VSVIIAVYDHKHHAVMLHSENFKCDSQRTSFICRLNPHRHTALLQCTFYDPECKMSVTGSEHVMDSL
jgi:hypothetical protein